MFVHGIISAITGVAFGLLYHQLFRYSVTQLYKRAKRGPTFAYAMANFVFRYGILTILLAGPLLFAGVYHISFVTAFIVVFFFSTIKLARADL